MNLHIQFDSVVPLPICHIHKNLVSSSLSYSWVKFHLRIFFHCLDRCCVYVCMCVCVCEKEREQVRKAMETCFVLSRSRILRLSFLNAFSLATFVLNFSNASLNLLVLISSLFSFSSTKISTKRFSETSLFRSSSKLPLKCLRYLRCIECLSEQNLQSGIIHAIHAIVADPSHLRHGTSDIAFFPDKKRKFNKTISTSPQLNYRKENMPKPHLDFFGAPVAIGLSIVALGKTTSYVRFSLFCL